MADIEKKLAEVAPPGEKQDEKKEAIIRLFREKGGARTNPQGIDVLEDLVHYSNW